MHRAGAAPIAAIAAALIVLGTACDRAGGREAGVTTRVDTAAGVVRIQHSGTSAPIDPVPFLTLGEMGGLGAASPEEFGRIRGVVADGRGRIYVGDGQALEIRVFGPDGGFLHRLGGKGGGPGEIEGLHGIGWLGEDSLVVVDHGNARLMLLSASGEQLDQWPWMRLTGTGPFMFAGGPREFFAYGFERGRNADGTLRPVWVRYTPEGPQDTLALPRLEERIPGSGVLCRAEGAISAFSNPHADRLIRAPAPGGERVTARASGYRLAFLDPAGDTVRVLSREVDPVPVTDAEWAPTDSAYQEFRQTWHGADCEGTIERPQHKPMLLDVFFSHDGRLLVERSAAEGTALDVYDHDYGWLGTLALPERDRSESPFLRDGRLYLVLEDTLGIQRVQAYRVGAGAGAPWS